MKVASGSGESSKPEPEHAALAFLDTHFPDALVALLAGSVTRGNATATSDLDLVLLTHRPEAPYRETFREHGWPIEVFVYTPTTYQQWFNSDAKRRRPSLPTMCSEGVVLKDHAGMAAQLKQDAERLLAAGPEPLSPPELDAARYRITDLLMDIENASPPELPFIVVALVPALADLLCDVHNKWRGDGKWTSRAVAAFSPSLANQLESATSAVMKEDITQPLIELADETLQKVGGRLFEGYAAGKTASR